MAMMGYPPSPLLAILLPAIFIITCSSFLSPGTPCSSSRFAAEAFIPPVGPICQHRRIVFSSDAFLVMRSTASSNDGTGDRTTTANHPPPLAFLDDRYADLFRVKKESSNSSVWGTILGRLHSKHKPAAKLADNNKRKHDQPTSLHPPSRPRSPPILKLDPETGRYVIQKQAASVSSAHDVPKHASNATHAQVGIEPKEMLVSSELQAPAEASPKHQNITQENVPTHEETADSTAHTGIALVIPPSISHHEEGSEGRPDSSSSSSSSSPPPTTSIAVHDGTRVDSGHHSNQESKGETQEEQQLTADLLDVVGRASSAESSTEDDGRIITVTADMNSSAQGNDKFQEISADAGDDVVKAGIEHDHQQASSTDQVLAPPDNEDDASKDLPDASPAVDNDVKSSDDIKIPIATLASTADPDSGIDTAITSAKNEEVFPQLPATSSLEQQHPITLSEQSVRVIKSAAEAATKIAFFVGKAALTLAVAVAKAALALDEERNIVDPVTRIDDDDLDRDASVALKMAEKAMSHSSDQGSRSALFGSQRTGGREAKKTRDFFFGLFGWLNVAKLANMAPPTAQAATSASITGFSPHPPSPPTTLEALQSLVASLSKEISAAVDDGSSIVQQEEQKVEDTKPIMEIEISEKASKRHITSIEIHSAIQKAREAAAKASREADELEAMLLGLGR